jgi:hypothetical protein
MSTSSPSTWTGDLAITFLVIRLMCPCPVVWWGDTVLLFLEYRGSDAVEVPLESINGYHFNYSRSENNYIVYSGSLKPVLLVSIIDIRSPYTTFSL